MQFSQIQRPETLDKATILKYVSEEEIMHYYTGVPPDTTGDFPSPIRKDDHPSATYYYKQGKIRLNDLGSYFIGDCYDVVAKQTGLGQNSSGVFGKVLEEIWNTMIKREPVKKPKIYDTEVLKKMDKSAEIQFAHREFTSEDKEYWYGRFNFTFPWSWMEKLLNQYRVFSASHVWINYEGRQRLWKIATPEEPMYVYRVKIGSGIFYKVYRPFSIRKDKWRGNTPSYVIHGYHMLDKTKPALLNKSLKDVIYAKIFDVNSYAYQGETQLGEPLSNTTAILGDNDYPGKRSLVKYRQQYPHLKVFMFPNGMEKDFTDNLYTYGSEEIQKLVTRWNK